MSMDHTRTLNRLAARGEAGGLPAELPDTVVVGLGVTGLSCVRYLSRKGVRFAVTDTRADPPGRAEFVERYPQVPLALGGIQADWIGTAGQVVVSPGVPLSTPLLAEALARGADVIGDIELFARETRAPVAAITGTNGKSTVTSLLGEMCTAAPLATRVGGNLGTPALDLLGSEPPDIHVLELSSFQLEATRSLRPEVAAVLNVSPDHMDRYGSLFRYAAAKERIFHAARTAVVNADDPLVAAMAPTRGPVLSFTLATPGALQFGLREQGGTPWLSEGEHPLLDSRELRLRGRHNLANALAALALGRALGLPLPRMLEVVRRFPGLPHRCQFVAEHAGVQWYDDSKGTNVGATVAAIAGFEGQPLVLIAGGQGKGQDFSALARVAGRGLRAAVLLGEDAGRLAGALSAHLPVHPVADMREAVQRAAELARPGDAVLLSPACASQDMFRDYNHRGEVYTGAVRALLGS